MTCFNSGNGANTSGLRQETNPISDCLAPSQSKPSSQSITIAPNKIKVTFGWYWCLGLLCSLFLAAQTRALELHNFYDENFQTCISEQAMENGWQSLDEVVQLSCSNRGIREVWGLDQLPNLTQLDLSHNPMQYLGPLFGLQHSLQRLDLSGTALFDIGPIAELQALTHLYLNDVQFIDGDGSYHQDQLHHLLQSNLQLTHLGLNGFRIYDPYTLFMHLTPNLVSLELSRTGLSYFPIPLDYFSGLEKLDLSHNPIRHLAPAQTLEHRLKQLNLSGTELYDLYELQQFRALTHLILNDVSFTGWQDPQQMEYELQHLLAINPQLTHLGLNGFVITDVQVLLQQSSGLISLELSNTGLTEFYVSHGDLPWLETLDLSANPLRHLHLSPEHEYSLKQLNLSETQVHDLSGLPRFTGLTHLLLNAMQFREPHSANNNDAILYETLMNNAHLTHLGLNGIVLDHPAALIDQLSPELVSLELGGVGLQEFNRPLDHFPNLQALDLSNNPLEYLGVYGPNLTLRKLNLSGTRLHGLYNLSQFHGLRELFLNNLTFSGWLDPTSLQHELEHLLNNNPALTHLGLSGFRVSEPQRLFQYLPRNLIYLDLSNSGLNELPYYAYPMPHLEQLQVLDLSKNPLKNVDFLYGLRHSLRYLDLSETQVDGLYALGGATRLTHLYLNGVDFYQGAYLGDHEYMIHQLLMSNPNLTHLGLNGLAITDFHSLFDRLSPRLVSLELSNTGLAGLPFPLHQFMGLRLLDLSYNPLQDLGPLYGLESVLQHINLSGTQLYGLDQLNDFNALRHLLLNDIEFVDQHSAYHQEFVVQTLLSQNPHLTHVGLNGFAISDFQTIFYRLNPSLQSLQLSATGLSQLPYPLYHFSRLESLDLSRNPLVDLGPLHGLNHSLKKLDLSETQIEGLYELLELQALTHLKLNNIEFPEYLYAFDHEHLIAEVLGNNPNLSHIGLSGIPLTPEFGPVMSRLASLPVVSLELANTGIVDLHELHPIIYQLQYLDLSSNAIQHLYPLQQGFELRYLYLDNNDISDVYDLWILMPQLKLLSLLRNEHILCTDLNELEARLSADAEFYRPFSCLNDGEQPVAYCSARGQMSSYEWIDSVAVNQTTHKSGNNGGYANHTSVVFEVLRGESTAIRLTPGFSHGSYMEHWAVWIDYNNDGVFTPSEKVLSGMSSSAIAGEFIIPVGAVEGKLRMRVAMRWDRAPDACGDFTWGEVNDYSININSL